MSSAAVTKSGFEKSRSICCASERLDSYLEQQYERELYSAFASNEAVEMNLSHGTTRQSNRSPVGSLGPLQPSEAETAATG